MVEPLHSDYHRQGVVHLPAFLAGAQLEQFASVLADVRWVERPYEETQSRVPDPARHGLLTGRICEFLSQAPLLDRVASLTGHRPGHLACNFVRLDAGDALGWDFLPGLAAPTALTVNLVADPVEVVTDGGRVTRLGPGEAALLALSRHRHRLTAARPAIVIDGRFLG